jgi:hypothetical protein
MTNTKTQEIIPVDVTGTQIEQYGQREIVRELVSRLMLFHPAAKEVGEPGMLAAAQLAVLIGASPLPGLNEIHIWKDPKTGNVIVQPGINYDRRRGNDLGGVFWVDDPRPMTIDERAAYLVPEGIPAAICKGARYDRVRELLQLGVSVNDAVKGMTMTGVGTVDKTSKGALYAKKNRPLVWTATKCAEADLLRKLFPNLERPEDPYIVAREAIDKMTVAQDGVTGIDTGNALLFGDNGADWDDDTFAANAGEIPGVVNGELVDGEPEADNGLAFENKMQFYAYVKAEIPYYRHTRHVANAARVLELQEAIKTKNWQAAFEKLNEHASAKADQEAEG